MATPPITPSQTALLQAASNSIAAASASVQAALLNSTSVPIVLTDFQRVKRYFAAKIIEGFAIGIVFLFACLLDKSGDFVKFINENFTKIPPIAVLIGVLGGLTYSLHQTKVGFLAAASRTWLDFVQQFFTLGVVAFWLIKAGLFFRKTFFSEFVVIKLELDYKNFLAMLVGALLIGSFWELKDVTLPSFGKRVAFCGTVVGLLLLLILMHSSDGGHAMLPTL
jgi:hypothetical protein